MGTDGKALIIVQARMGSSRFPGKTLEDLNGQPLIWHLFEQVRHCRMVDKAILATTSRPEDDALAAFADKQGWPLFRGSTEDVLYRYHQAALAFGASEDTPIIRLTGDDVFPDPFVIDAMVEIYQSLSAHIEAVSTDRSDLFPYGTGHELFSFRALDIAEREATDPGHREHVSILIFEQPERFPCLTIRPSGQLPGFALSVDTPDDLERNRAVLRQLDEIAVRPFRLNHVLAAMARVSQS